MQLMTPEEAREQHQRDHQTWRFRNVRPMPRTKPFSERFQQMVYLLHYEAKQERAMIMKNHWTPNPVWVKAPNTASLITAAGHWMGLALNEDGTLHVSTIVQDLTLSGTPEQQIEAAMEAFAEESISENK
jgi:hypothetical protein